MTALLPHARKSGVIPNLLLRHKQRMEDATRSVDAQSTNDFPDQWARFISHQSAEF